uniref:F-box domain-containing protein n=1 Tax=Caenorhabditis japonica TaxID=281687 RepID=A0A8R1E4A1_CAEJA
MELQRKRSFNTSTVSHDFRKEYKGSFLEKKCMKQRKEQKSSKSIGLRSIAGWFLTKAKKSGAGTASTTMAVAPKSPAPVATKTTVKGQMVTVQEKSPSHFDRIPNELLFEILNHCKSEPTTVNAARRVSRRFNACMSHVADVNVNDLSRLVITGLGRKGVEMRWVSYVGQKTKVTVVPWSVIRSQKPGVFEFNFKRFAIQRILLKNIPLSDDLVDFLRHQLQFSDLSKLLQLSLTQVDFSPSNCLSLHRFLAPLTKSLEIFEITQCTGMRADSVTDEHLAQLNAATVRRIAIDGVRFAGGATRQLDIGDGALRRFARLGAFPTMILDRCAVTTNTVCDYTKEWFEQCNESEKQLRSQVCTVKRCPRVKGSQFEAECRRRGLRCKNRRGSGSLTLYNVQEENTKREFTIALAALEEKEMAEKLKISTDSQQPQMNLLAVPSA